MSCECDKLIYPPAQHIPAGLKRVARQVGTFKEFRRALLASTRHHEAMRHWDVRNNDDLGVMLLEMGAYVMDVLSFYDETIANECYLQTAQLRPSIRKLVDLLGYLPRPAVAAQTRLAVLAEGPKPVVIPEGTSFRSGVFDDEVPQIFESGEKTLVYSEFNTWPVKWPKRSTWAPTAIEHETINSLVEETEPEKCESSSILLDIESVRLENGDAVFIYIKSMKESTGQIRKVSDVVPLDGKDQIRYGKVILDYPVSFTGDTLLSSIILEKPTTEAYLWNPTSTSGGVLSIGKLITGITQPVVMMRSISGAVEEVITTVEEAIEDAVEMAGQVIPGTGSGGGQQQQQTDALGDEITLDGAYKHILPGEIVVLVKGDELRWFKVKSVHEEKGYSVQQVNPNDSPVEIPSFIGPATVLRLDKPVNTRERSNFPESAWVQWENQDLLQVKVLHRFENAGTLTVEANTTLSDSDPVLIDERIEFQNLQTLYKQLVLADSMQRGVLASGEINFDDSSITLDTSVKWNPNLRLPVDIFGNLLPVTRGECVKNEILGNGDSSQLNQSFKLVKKPLTYLPKPTADNEAGIASTLEIYVNGIRWSEVPSFFGKKESDQVYVVLQDDEENTIVTFGDGKTGSRLPTGKDNVLANYRHGAGYAAPPEGSITQITKPVKGLTSVRQPIAAGGGEDRESPESMQNYAPNSALILGRAVSLQDIQAVVSQFPSVRAVDVKWGWDGSIQRPLVRVWYMANSNLTEQISQRIKGIIDPTTPINVRKAQAVNAELFIGVVVDPSYLDLEVKQNVNKYLTASSTGILLPENIGIDKPLFRSQILEEVLDVEGVETVYSLNLVVPSLNLFGDSFTDIGIRPGIGNYFNFTNIVTDGVEMD